jgi:uncharacterized coiled-coil protein SlyX
MPKEGMVKIKEKLQELGTLIKEQTSEETREIKEELLQSVNEMKASVDQRFQIAEEKLSDSLQEAIGELEGKALKVQYTIQEKLSQGIAQKDQIVVKTADSLIEAINKMKNALQSKE